MKESLLDKLDPTPVLVKTYSADTILDYVVCPAKAFITMKSRDVPARQRVKERLPKGLSEITLTMLNGNRPKNPEALVADVTTRVFDGITYDHRDRDFEAIVKMYMNYINMLPTKDLKVDGLARPFDIAYNGTVIESQVDLLIHDIKTGRKMPAIVDFSNTKYEPGYNPIIYRCQMVTDFLNINQTNTDVLVISVSTGQVWPYMKLSYSNLLHAAICEMITAIKADLFPVRFGWWCAGCYWRGLCHRMLEVRV